jgi:DNA invertase Pin-like site-specific DNA recombinase
MRRTTPTATPIKGVGYIRNSRLGKRERGNNASVSEQRRIVKQYAEQHGIDLIDIIEEENTSGQTLDRPGWWQARQLVTDGVVQAIVGWDLDRMSRDESWSTMAAVADIEAEGGQVHDRTGRITVGTFEGEAVATLRAMMNRAEWRKIRERNSGNVRRAIIEHGAHLVAPYGYVKPSDGDKVLVVNDDEAPTVQRAFQLRADGWSWPRIAAELNANWAAPRPYKRHGQVAQASWSPHHVRRMVLNRVYTGVAYSGEHEQAGAHDALVSQSLFDKATRVKGRKFSADNSASYLLSGLVRCSGCGYAMVHTRSSRANGASRYYQCQRRKYGCPAPVSVPAAELEAHALDVFKAQVATLRAYRPVADDSAYLAAEAALTEANDGLRLVIKNTLRLGDLPAAEQAMVDDELAAARALVREREAAVTQARTQAAGIDLPADLNADNIDAEPVADQRHLLGLVFVGVAVRKGIGWRESVEHRAQFLGRNEAPSNSTALIPHVVALDWDPPSAGVAAA